MIQDTRIYDKSDKTEMVKFKGKATWCQLIDLNRFGNWSLNLYPDNESLERLRALTLKNVFKKDDNGYYLQMSRQSVIEFTKGVQTTVTPVKIKMKDGSPVTARIGDGSDVEVVCELRKFKVPNSNQFGNAIRLYGVIVENLVPSSVPERPPVEVPTEGWETIH